ncbi:MAG: hypothetical protein P1P64_08385 [Treponemataceae bacterium]
MKKFFLYRKFKKSLDFCKYLVNLQSLRFNRERSSGLLRREFLKQKFPPDFARLAF